MARKERVTRVIDGDTFRTASRRHSVRLANVDGPEKGKPGAAVATRKLGNLIRGKDVSIQTVARDTYGRSIANVRVGRRSVNRAMRPENKKRK